MNPPDDMSATGRLHYLRHRDGIGAGEGVVAAVLREQQIARARELAGRRLPDGWPDTSDATTARKLLAALLDIGWSPPSPFDVDAAAEWARDRVRRRYGRAPRARED